jgi:hypothetical protein
VFRPWPSSDDPRAKRQKLEVAMGFIGFFGVIVLADAAYEELHGGGLDQVLILVALLVLLATTYRSWRRLGP